MSGFELATSLVPIQSGLTLPDFIMVAPEFRYGPFHFVSSACCCTFVPYVVLAWNLIHGFGILSTACVLGGKALVEW